MLKTFRTYQLAVEMYQVAKKIKLRNSLQDQLIRASSSICLNLAEGSARPSKKDRMRFYSIAFGSLREVQALIDLEATTLQGLEGMADHLGAALYRLTRS